MTRPVLGVAFPLVALFALLLGGLHLQAPGGAVRLAFGGCAMPCWFGIEPGTTEQQAALAQLRAAGWQLDGECNPAIYQTCSRFIRQAALESDPAVAFVYVAAERVQQVALLNFPLPLGELWASFGAPDYVAVPPYHDSVPLFDMAVWFGSSGLSGRMGFPCPADFGAMLAHPLDTMLVWQPGTAMSGTAAITVTELRRMLRAWCSA